MMHDKLIIVIPAYNEQDNIKVLVSDNKNRSEQWIK